jgi:S1-C subfamily serine protease
MAGIFHHERARSVEEPHVTAEPDSSQTPLPFLDTEPAGGGPATEPSAPAPTVQPWQEMSESVEDVATPLPPSDAPADATTSGHEPPGQAPAAKAPPDRRRPTWRGPLAGIAALAATALLISGGMAIGRATAPDGTSVKSATTTAASSNAQDLQQNVINVIHAVQPSVVEVMSRNAQGGAIGSGEILRVDGYIVTNHHVVAGFSTFTVTLATGQTVPAQLVGAAPQDDLAVLRVQLADLRPISIGDSRTVQVGQFAIAMGSPLGLQQSATLGIVSALDRQATEAQSGPFLAGLIQTSAPINPGNSGGALVDLQGRLIGIPTLGAENPESGAPAGGIGFAIPSDRVRFVADQLIKYGHVANSGQGFLGIQGQNVTPDLATAFKLPVQSGVLIAGFANDAAGVSPAAKAGLLRGDIVVAINGKQVATEADLAAALLTQTPGTQMTITVQRGAKQQSAKVTLGERPAKQAG